MRFVIASTRGTPYLLFPCKASQSKKDFFMIDLVSKWVIYSSITLSYAFIMVNGNAKKKKWLMQIRYVTCTLVTLDWQSFNKVLYGNFRSTHPFTLNQSFFDRALFQISTVKFFMLRLVMVFVNFWALKLLFTIAKTGLWSEEPLSSFFISTLFVFSKYLPRLAPFSVFF